MLIFKNHFEVTPDNLEALSEIQRQQLFIEYEKYSGIEAESIEAMFDAEDEGIAICEYFQAFEGDDAAPKYDVWILNVDSGSVFVAGTTEDTGVGMIQNDFGADFDNTPEREALAKALQDAHTAFIRANRNTNGKGKAGGAYHAYRNAVNDIIAPAAAPSGTEAIDAALNTEKPVSTPSAAQPAPKPAAKAATKPVSKTTAKAPATTAAKAVTKKSPAQKSVANSVAAKSGAGKSLVKKSAAKSSSSKSAVKKSAAKPAKSSKSVKPVKPVKPKQTGKSGGAAKAGKAAIKTVGGKKSGGLKPKRRG